ncbi:MAG: hypothetical protein V1862_04040 [Methanobacteriota archaeon]
MISNNGIPAVYDGKALVPDHPVDLDTGKKYLLIIEEVPPDNPLIKMNTEERGVCETAFMSEKSLAHDWLTPEEDEAWDYL